MGLLRGFVQLMPIMRYTLPLLILVFAASRAGGAEPSAEEEFRSVVWPALEESCLQSSLTGLFHDEDGDHVVGLVTFLERRGWM